MSKRLDLSSYLDELASNLAQEELEEYDYSDYSFMEDIEEDQEYLKPVEDNFAVLQQSNKSLKKDTKVSPKTLGTHTPKPSSLRWGMPKGRDNR